MTIEPGLCAAVTLTVAEKDTALAFGSGTVPVLATPRIVALVEEATVAALDGQLPEGTTSVGTSVTLQHLVATGVGTTVVAEATLTAAVARTLTFDVTVRDDVGELARGTVVRAVVDEIRFLSRAR